MENTEWYLGFNGHGYDDNGFECFGKCNIFCCLDLSKEKLCSILVSGNVRFNKVVWINHDNVARRGLLDILTPLSDLL